MEVIKLKNDKLYKLQNPDIFGFFIENQSIDNLDILLNCGINLTNININKIFLETCNSGLIESAKWLYENFPNIVINNDELMEFPKHVYEYFIKHKLEYGQVLKLLLLVVENNNIEILQCICSNHTIYYDMLITLVKNSIMHEYFEIIIWLSRNYYHYDIFVEYVRTISSVEHLYLINKIIYNDRLYIKNYSELLILIYEKQIMYKYTFDHDYINILECEKYIMLMKLLYKHITIYQEAYKDNPVFKNIFNQCVVDIVNKMRQEKKEWNTISNQYDFFKFITKNFPDIIYDVDTMYHLSKCKSIFKIMYNKFIKSC